MNNNISFSNLFSSIGFGNNNNRVGNVKTDDNNNDTFGSILNKNLAGDEVETASTMDMSDLFSGLLEGEKDMNGVMQVFFGMLGLGVKGGVSDTASMLSAFNSISGKSGGVSTGPYAYTQQNFLQSTKNVPVPNMKNVLYGEDLSANPIKKIPLSSSMPSYPYMTNDYRNRSASNYRQIINQFDVENNERYKPYKKNQGDTYCNIFTWDVTRAMGAEIPHYINPETMEPMYYPNTEGGLEISANSTYRWLENVGEDYGWYKVTAAQAQALANQGRPAVTAMFNSEGGSGHVQVVCPSANGTYDQTNGVTVAQAGSKRYNYTTLNNTTSNPSKFVYYAHI